MIIEPLTRKIGKAQVSHEADKETGIAELLNRGQQLLLELDRQHNLLIKFAREGLKPDIAAWRGAKRSMAAYAEAYSELMRIVKRLNVITQNGE